MAGEVKVSSNFQIIKPNAGNLADNDSGLTFDQAGTHTQQTIQDVGFATHELVTLDPDLGTLGWIKLKNLDATNYIQLGIVVSAAFQPVARLVPGGIAGPFRADATLYVKANTASCKMRVSAAEL